MSDPAARAWLAKRTPPAPGPLLARMDVALASLGRSAEGAPLEQQFGDAAVACLSAALRSGRAREAAFDLLAADALLTYGCEAAVESGTGALARFADTYGAARLAALLD